MRREREEETRAGFHRGEVARVGGMFKLTPDYLRENERELRSRPREGPRAALRATLRLVPPSVFPPLPPSFRARSGELRALSTMVRSYHPARIALIGSGGSGKSTLACALGHRMSRSFRGNIHWFRIGAWDTTTLLQMLAMRFGLPSRGDDLARAIRRSFEERGASLVVLDNHEDDAATAALLDALHDAPVTWILTARRCLLGGVSVYPVVPPFITVGKSPFPRIASLTRLLRWNAVALDLADALVGEGFTSVEGLEDWLRKKGVDRVRTVEHEDDIVEVARIVEQAWARLPQAARRMLGVLAHMAGDHMDARSLSTLSDARGAAARRAIEALTRLRLVQEPIEGRFALHATVRHALAKRTSADHQRYFLHYVALLEAQPARLELEQTHLFAAMDHAQATGDLATILRVHRLVEALGGGEAPQP